MKALVRTRRGEGPRRSLLRYLKTSRRFVVSTNQEEVIDEDGLAVAELLLGAVEVEVDVEVLDEAGDGVLVGVALLLDHLDQILHHVPPGALVADDGRGQVSQDPGARRLKYYLRINIRILPVRDI